MFVSADVTVIFFVIFDQLDNRLICDQKWSPKYKFRILADSLSQRLFVSILVCRNFKFLILHPSLVIFVCRITAAIIVVVMSIQEDHF